MLKSLELFGFKSFADRTRFEFATGITCVVGPNGSGKSNVVDALKWILGDQSAKSLRGKDMTDVIFNGAAGRKASPYAEATLTFDNSSGLLPIETTEVHIGRRIWRNGDAEYLINRSAARLKDVRDLFLGTGAGASAYSIIEQGRVDQILQANPANRRAVFEEAAGISRFRSREQEARKKLERVDQNLLRLTDIVDEVEGQLNSTRSQAAKAAKYRDLDRELQKWWLGLAADDARALQADLTKIEEGLAKVTAELDGSAARQQELEAGERAFDEQITAIDEDLRAAEKRLTSSRQACAGQEAASQFQANRLIELEGELTRLQRQQVTLRRRVYLAEQDLASSRQRRSSFDAEFQSADGDIASRTELIAKLTAQLEVDRAQLQILEQQSRELERAETNLRLQSEQIDHRHKGLEDQHAQIVAEQAELTERATVALDARDARQAEWEQAAADQAAATAQLRQIQTQRQSLVGVSDESKAELAGRREYRSAAHARKNLLEDLERREEGLGIGVREILHRARTNPTAPWNSVVGVLADLLQVNLENAALVEVALGHRAQLIVLRDYDPLLEYLHAGRTTLSGRVSFLAYSGAEAANKDTPSVHEIGPTRFGRVLPALDDEAGIISRADLLVQSEQEGPGLAAAVLADTWIVTDLVAAARLANGPGRGCRFVTLQGEVLEADGTLSVGLVGRETAVLPRKSELRQLRAELVRLDREIEDQEVALQSVYAALSGTEQELEAAANVADHAAGIASDRRAALVASEQICEQLTQEAAVLERRMADLTAQNAQLLADQEQLREQGLKNAEHQTVLEQEIEQHTHRLRQQEREVQHLQQRLAADQLEAAKQSERLTAWTDQIQRLEEDLSTRLAQKDEAERRLAAAREQLSQITLQLLNTRAWLDEQVIHAEEIATEVTRFAAGKAELRQSRTKIVDAELEHRRYRRELAERKHAFEMQERDQKHALETLAGRLDEDNQLTIETLLAGDHSAITLYRQERLETHESSSDEPEAPVIRETDLALDQLTFAEIRPEVDARVQRLRRKLKSLGAVNTDSLDNLEELETRHGRLSAQLQDLIEAKKTLEDIIRRSTLESRKMFAETFDAIRTQFQDLFRKVFGGGEGDIILEDPNDILSCGIEIKARPPGKELRSISLLSGGEKTMTAIALIMAIFRTKPSPFCILDEVDAALDEANVERFTGVVREFQTSTQFIMITHHKRSMTVADVLYGVTMEESGISKRMSVRFEDVSDDGHFKAAA